ASDKTVHFGLAGETAIKTVEIRWPSGKVQVLSGLQINRPHEIVEPKE
ncbi:MAG: hypothetical protein EHM61_12965, partial [Acidobacteria bacterium]